MGRYHETPNTIQLVIKNDGKIDRYSILTAVVEQLNVEPKDIATFGPPFDKKEWLFTFRRDIVDELVGKKIILKINTIEMIEGKKVYKTIDEEIIVKDYNKNKKKKVIYEVYKINWLPFCLEESQVKQFIHEIIGNDNIRIKNCFEEKYIDRDHEDSIYNNLEVKITTGIWRVAISYEEDIKINDIRGVKNKFYGKRTLITKFGDQQKCFGCREFGHVRMECPNVDVICKSCKKRDIKSARMLIN